MTDINVNDGRKALLHSSDRIYVTQAGILRGFITMSQLLTNTLDTAVETILNKPEEVCYTAHMSVRHVYMWVFGACHASHAC